MRAGWQRKLLPYNYTGAPPAIYAASICTGLSCASPMPGDPAYLYWKTETKHICDDSYGFINYPTGFDVTAGPYAYQPPLGNWFWENVPAAAGTWDVCLSGSNYMTLAVQAAYQGPAVSNGNYWIIPFDETFRCKPYCSTNTMNMTEIITAAAMSPVYWRRHDLSNGISVPSIMSSMGKVAILTLGSPSAGLAPGTAGAGCTLTVEQNRAGCGCCSDLITNCHGTTLNVPAGVNQSRYCTWGREQYRLGNFGARCPAGGLPPCKLQFTITEQVSCNLLPTTQATYLVRSASTYSLSRTAETLSQSLSVSVSLPETRSRITRGSPSDSVSSSWSETISNTISKLTASFSASGSGTETASATASRSGSGTVSISGSGSPSWTRTGSVSGSDGASRSRDSPSESGTETVSLETLSATWTGTGTTTVSGTSQTLSGETDSGTKSRGQSSTDSRSGLSATASGSSTWSESATGSVSTSASNTISSTTTGSASADESNSSSRTAHRTDSDTNTAGDTRTGTGTIVRGHRSDTRSKTVGHVTFFFGELPGQIVLGMNLGGWARAYRVSANSWNVYALGVDGPGTGPGATQYTPYVPTGALGQQTTARVICSTLGAPSVNSIWSGAVPGTGGMRMSCATNWPGFGLKPQCSCSTTSGTTPGGYVRIRLLICLA